jgi:hypothetical protein
MFTPSFHRYRCRTSLLHIAVAYRYRTSLPPPEMAGSNRFGLFGLDRPLVSLS